jgi:hypothetical protein
MGDEEWQEGVAGLLHHRRLFWRSSSRQCQPFCRRLGVRIHVCPDSFFSCSCSRSFSCFLLWVVESFDGCLHEIASLIKEQQGFFMF